MGNFAFSEVAPEGWARFTGDVYTNGTVVILTGNVPTDEEDAPELTHNCDEMGCGSVGPHVVARGVIDYWDGLDWRAQELRLAAVRGASR
jgi:hypothetical protein